MSSTLINFTISVIILLMLIIFKRGQNLKYELNTANILEELSTTTTEVLDFNMAPKESQLSLGCFIEDLVRTGGWEILEEGSELRPSYLDEGVVGYHFLIYFWSILFFQTHITLPKNLAPLRQKQNQIQLQTLLAHQPIPKNSRFQILPQTTLIHQKVPI